MFWVFWSWNLKMILLYLKSAPSNLSNSKFLRKKKQKCPNLESKMPYLAYLDENFKKTIAMLEISTLEWESISTSLELNLEIDFPVPVFNKML